MKWFRAVGLYLVAELGFFVLIKRFFRATWSELAGPYLAFAMAMMFFLLLVWWLRNWEKRNPSPRRLALGWGLSVAVFASMVDGAFAYSGVVLGLINPHAVRDWGGWSFAVIASILCVSIVVYQGAYRIVQARTSAKGHK
jgi:membrane protease YdiL (CAAX protease family)